MPNIAELRGDIHTRNINYELAKKMNLENVHDVIMFSIILIYEFLVYLHETNSKMFHEIDEIRKITKNIEIEFDGLVEYDKKRRIPK
jgi:hypothetical protein